MKTKNLLPGLLLACCLAITACSSKATAENYAKLEPGMHQDMVHSIIGSADETSSGDVGGLSMTTETWKGPKETITATFVVDKLVLKDIKPNAK